MTQTIINWPYPIYSGEVGLNLSTLTRSSSNSLSGFSQVIGTGVSRWNFTMDFNTIHTQLIPMYRATLAKADGRIGIFRIPVRDRFQPKPDADGLPGRTRLFHSNGVPFSSGAGYQRMGVPIRASVEAGKNRFAASDTVLSFLYPGMFFGLGDDLHVCVAREAGEIVFKPSARRVHINRQISLRPVLIARLIDDGSGALALEMGRWGRPSIQFIEEVLP